MNSLYISWLRNSFCLFCLLLVVSGFSTTQASTKRGITIEDLVTIRDIKSMRLSPDGKYITFQTMQRHIKTNDFTTGWYIAATKPGATAHKVASGTQPFRDDLVGQFSSSAIFWTLDNEWIYFTKKHADTIQIWRSSLKSPEAQQVTHNPGDVQSLRISPDGSKVFFTIGRTHAEIETLKKDGARQGYLQQDPALYYVGRGAVIPPCSYGTQPLPAAMRNEKLSCRLTDWVYDIKSGVERKATEAEIKALSDQMRPQGPQLSETVKLIKKRSPDGTQLAWIENENPEIYKGVFPPVVLGVSVNGKDLRCPAKECIGVGYGLWWHPNGTEIIFRGLGDPNKSTTFYGWTPGLKTVRTILSSDDRFTGCDLTGKRLICGWSTWTSPKKIASLDLDSGKVFIITDVNPEFHNIRFTKVEKILGEDDYGHKVHGHLVYPKGYKKGQKYPLVITSYHSYGFLRGATGWDQPIHVLAQNGIAVLSFDHRQNSSDYSKKIPHLESIPVHFKNLYIKQGPATAVENMLDRLVNRGIVDPKRVGITGFSYGDQILSTILMRRNYAAASSAGLASVPTYRRFPPSSGYAKWFDEIFGKPFSAKGQKMRRKYSLMVHADKIDTPVLMQVADREFHAFEDTYNALMDAGKPVEMYVYPDEMHVKWQPAHKHIVYHRNLDWFNFWLRDVEDKNPAKAEQYQRWRELRDMHQANLARLNKDK